jgi:hypothetical protein
MTPMHIVALQAVSGSKNRNAFSQHTLRAFQSLGLALTGSDLNEEALN